MEHTTVTRDSLQNFELATALATVWPSVRNGFLGFGDGG